MEGKTLERAEKVVRSLPIVEPILGRTECQLGEILYAYGKDGQGVYHGVWGIDQPTAIMRTLEFKPGVDAEMVVKDLIMNAVWVLRECEKRGLLRSGATFGKKY